MLVACAAHWYASLLFLVPVAVVAGAMRWSTWRADRLEEAPEGGRAGELAAEGA